MVSVIVPVYNVEQYLKKCVDSILEQKYQDIEIILVDDGSTDSSGAICDSYSQNSNVRVVHKKNAGLGMARNTGIELARGEYVSFLDSDDYWSPDALSSLMAAMNRYDSDTCIGGYSRVTNDGIVLSEEQPKKCLYETHDDVVNDFLPRLMGSSPKGKDSFRPSVWNAIYSMKIIMEYNIRFPSEREYIAEDMIFDLDYYRYANRVSIVDSYGYFYRVTPNSLTQKYNAQRFDKAVYLFKEIMNRSSSFSNPEDIILRAKRQFFVYLKICIKQENIKCSRLSYRQAIVNINDMCKDAFTEKCLSDYPVKLLGYRQRVFLNLVKHHSGILLYVLVCSGLADSKRKKA